MHNNPPGSSGAVTACSTGVCWQSWVGHQAVEGVMELPHYTHHWRWCSFHSWSVFVFAARHVHLSLNLLVLQMGAPLNHNFYETIFSYKVTHEKFSLISGNIIHRLQLYFCVSTSSMGVGISGVAKLSCLLSVFLSSFSSAGRGFLWSSADTEFQNQLVFSTSQQRAQCAEECECWCGGGQAPTGPWDAHWSMSDLSLQLPLSSTKQAPGKCLGRKPIDWLWFPSIMTSGNLRFL